MSVRAIHGDCLAEIPKLVAEGVVVDSVVCDPPYHLTPTVKRFSKEGSAPAQFGKDGAMARLSAGFMQSRWDGGDIAFRPETWATVATILRPGAFLVAFGGTRSSHRMISAIEDAGFIIQDKLLWLFAVGFPKRKDMLKPAYEDICLCYKPGGKRTMQVDECRIGTEGGAPAPREGGASVGILGNGLNGGWGKPVPGLGRWPANCVTDGSEEVVACFPESGASNVRLSEDVDKVGVTFSLGRTGITPRGHNDSGGSAARFFMSAKAGPRDRWPTLKHEVMVSWTSESGPCEAVLLVAMALSPPRVTAASGSITADEWNTFLFGNGLTALCQRASKSTIRMTTSSITGLKTWSWLTRSLTSDFTPVVTSSPANGSSLAEHAESINLSISFILGETASLPNASRALSGGLFEIRGQERRGSHPTVKPVELMKWLVKLVTPENGTVIDPFAGTGSTGIAALATNRSAILIERELSYVSDIRERLAFYEGGGTHSMQAKNRNRTPFIPEGDLFATASPPRRKTGDLGSGFDPLFAEPLLTPEDADAATVDANPTGSNALTPQEIPASVTHKSTAVNATLFDHLDAADD